MRGSWWRVRNDRVSANDLITYVFVWSLFGPTPSRDNPAFGALTQTRYDIPASASLDDNAFNFRGFLLRIFC